MEWMNRAILSYCLFVATLVASQAQDMVVQDSALLSIGDSAVVLAGGGVMNFGEIDVDEEAELSMAGDLGNDGRLDIGMDADLVLGGDAENNGEIMNLGMINYGEIWGHIVICLHQFH